MADLNSAPLPSPDLGEKALDGHLERYKAQLAAWAEIQNQDAAMVPAMGSLLGGFAQIGLRSLFLVNGGALVAVLALLGNIWGKAGAADLASRMQPSAKELTAGLICAFFATGFAYFSQLLFTEFRYMSLGWRWAQKMRVVCIVLCLLSLGLFAYGVSSGISAIGKQTSYHQAVWSTIQHGDT